MHGRDRLLYTRAHRAKTLTTESRKNSSTLSVIGVVGRRRRNRFQRPGRPNDRQHVATNETRSGNRSVIAAIDSQTTCSYSTSIGHRGLSSTVWALKTTSGHGETGSTNIRCRPTCQTALKGSPCDGYARDGQRRR